MTRNEITKLLGIDAEEASTTGTITRVSSLKDANTDAVVFAEDAKALDAALVSRAGLILACETDAAGVVDDRVLVVPAPKYAFAQLARALQQSEEGPLVHPAAVVHPSATLGQRVRVGPLAVIEAEVEIGDDAVIGSGAVLCRGVSLGNRVVVQAGAVLGSTGFGYVRDSTTGEYVLFPQQGRLVIEDDVEIGANTTIDRGALEETRIGAGTKIDNLVHIGHNCIIGRNVVIAAQVGISGSCVVEDGAILAGQVGISDHCRIGKGVILGGQAGVFRGKAVEGPGQAFAGTPAEPIGDYLKGIAKVRRLK